LARPVLVALGTPAAELAEGDAALAIAPEHRALAAALAHWLSNPSEREALGMRARSAALSRHDRAAMAAAYEAVYDELG